MTKEVFLYILFCIIFMGGTIYNFACGRKTIYRTKITKGHLAIIIIIPLIFLAIAYFAGAGNPANYVLVLLGSTFALSPIFGQGIYDKGIYHLGSGGRSSFVRLSLWEDLVDYELDMEEAKLKMVKTKGRTLFPNQYYDLENIHEINQYIRNNIK